MNHLQLWALSSLLAVGVLLVGSLIWAHYRVAIKGFRWDYRKAGSTACAEAPLVALVATYVIGIGEILREIWQEFKKLLQPVGYISLMTIFILTAPVSFPLTAWLARRYARRVVLRNKKRDLKERAGGVPYDV